MTTGNSSEPSSVNKRGSRGNALRHGLSSRRVLPLNLAERRDFFLAALTAELHPRSVLEGVFVHEVARHSAALEIANQSEEAALRITPLLTGVAAIGTAMGPNDGTFLAAIGNDLTERACRYRRGHERGLYAAIRALLDCRDTSLNSVTAVKVLPFASEIACEQFLRDWQASRKWECSRCGCKRRRWLATRQRFECCGCEWQHGVRASTLVARSRLPLVSWLRAIAALLQEPQLTVNDLVPLTGIKRRQTLTELRGKILVAFDSPKADPLVAAVIEVVKKCRDTCASGLKSNTPGQNESGKEWSGYQPQKSGHKARQRKDL